MKFPKKCPKSLYQISHQIWKIWNYSMYRIKENSLCQFKDFQSKVSLLSYRWSFALILCSCHTYPTIFLLQLLQLNLIRPCEVHSQNSAREQQSTIITKDNKQGAYIGAYVHCGNLFIPVSSTMWERHTRQ